MKRLAILGAGGHARVVADAAEAYGWAEISLFDDAWPNVAAGPWPVLGSGSDLEARLVQFDGVVIAIGANAVRLDKQRRLLERDAPLVSIIHPAATVSRHALLGAGSVVFAGAVINPGVETGNAVIINTAATIDHDCRLGDAVHISPGAHVAGGVRIGDESWIGIGASVKELISIGARVKVGAGSAVVASIADNMKVVGIPARPLQKSDHA
jgi:sugar O-acyltransferase (sialic acid O-acetyltransferase NeuD family)